MNDRLDPDTSDVEDSEEWDDPNPDETSAAVGVVAVVGIILLALGSIFLVYGIATVIFASFGWIGVGFYLTILALIMLLAAGAAS